MRQIPAQFKSQTAQASPAWLSNPILTTTKDILSHDLLEALPNLLTGGKTDPRQDYLLLWMATKLEGVQPDFAPPCTVE